MTKPVALIRKAYRYRLRTLPAATERTLRRWDGCCRKVWNLAIDRQQQIRESGGKYTGFAGMCRWLTEWRGSEELAYLREVPVHVLQNVVRSLDRAYQRFFKKEGGYPRFKRYGEAVGLRET
ncbi:MAG: helix-turn-helix domain-containing protein, partial [Propionivibrio sp.]|nr:helix-turn-helix domain-containing protein [Propionivibrio sp.]